MQTSLTHLFMWAVPYAGASELADALSDGRREVMGGLGDAGFAALSAITGGLWGWGWGGWVGGWVRYVVLLCVCGAAVCAWFCCVCVTLQCARCCCACAVLLFCVWCCCVCVTPLCVCVCDADVCA